MRQRIKVKQLDELSERARERFLAWEQERQYTIDEYLEPPSIGYLIEFLSAQVPAEQHFEILREKAFNGGWDINTPGMKIEFEEQPMQLLDLLWEYTKYVLEQD